MVGLRFLFALNLDLPLNRLAEKKVNCVLRASVSQMDCVLE